MYVPIQLSVLGSDRICAEALAVFEGDALLAQTVFLLELARSDMSCGLHNGEDFVLDWREFQLLLFPLGVREDVCMAVRASESVTTYALKLTCLGAQLSDLVPSQVTVSFGGSQAVEENLLTFQVSLTLLTHKAFGYVIGFSLQPDKLRRTILVKISSVIFIKGVVE